MGFENNMINSLDRRNPGEHPVISKMHQEAVDVLSDNAFDPNDFVDDPYSRKSVDMDLAYVEYSKKKFEQNSSQEEKELKKVADVLEAILYNHLEMSEWMGPNITTMRPSEFDDIKNGVDIITEFNEEDITQHLALAVDITFASSESMGNKLERIKKEIDNDQLADMKYFESHYHKGPVRQIPRIIVGIEKEKVIELAGLWMRGNEGEKGINAKLGNHQAKNVIVTEIIEQLRTYRDYADRHGKLNAFKSYKDALATLQDLGSQLKDLSREEKEFVSEDKVCSCIRDEMRFKFSK